MSKTKATGGTHLGRDSRPKFLGVKLFDGQAANIVVQNLIVEKYVAPAMVSAPAKTPKWEAITRFTRPARA